MWSYLDTKLNEASAQVALEMMFEFACWDRMFTVVEQLFHVLQERGLRLRRNANLNSRTLICNISKKLRENCQLEYQTCFNVISSIVSVLEGHDRPLWREDPRNVASLLSLRRLAVALATHEDHTSSSSQDLEERIDTIYQIGTDGEAAMAKKLREAMREEAEDANRAAQCVLMRLRKSTEKLNKKDMSLLQDLRFLPLHYLASGDDDALQRHAVNVCADMDQALSRQIEDTLFSRPFLAYEADTQATALQNASDTAICQQAENEKNNEDDDDELEKTGAERVTTPSRPSSRHKKRRPVFLANIDDDDDEDSHMENQAERMLPPPLPALQIPDDDIDDMYCQAHEQEKSLLPEAATDDDTSTDVIEPPLRMSTKKRKRPIEDREDDLKKDIEADDSDLEDDEINQGHKGKRKLRIGKKGNAVRVRHRWTDAEVDSLIAGLQTYGTQWAKIRDAFAIFAQHDRSSSDLRDKWRNLEKRGYTIRPDALSDKEKAQVHQSDDEVEEEEEEVDSLAAEAEAIERETTPKKSGPKKNRQASSTKKMYPPLYTTTTSLKANDENINSLVRQWARSHLIPSSTDKIHMTQLREAFLSAHRKVQFPSGLRNCLSNPRSRISKSFRSIIESIVGEKRIASAVVINKINQVGVLGYRLRGPDDASPEADNMTTPLSRPRSRPHSTTTAPATTKEGGTQSSARKQRNSASSDDLSSFIQASATRHEQKAPSSSPRATPIKRTPPLTKSRDSAFYRDEDLARLAQSLSDTPAQASTPASANQQRTSSQQRKTSHPSARRRHSTPKSARQSKNLSNQQDEELQKEGEY